VDRRNRHRRSLVESTRTSIQAGALRGHNWVVELEGFDDDRAGERVLEAIQTAWIDEAS
jgi:hypothetical protein